MNLLPKIKPFLTGIIHDMWPKSRWQRAGIIASAIFAVVTIFAAYCGSIRPSHTFLGAIAPATAMAFPMLLYATGILLVVTFFVWRRGARIFLVTFIAIIPSAIHIAPLHLTPYITDSEERERSFTLLTYNVMSFFDYNGPFETGVPNRTMQYILDKNPDVVCLQETLRAAYVNTLNISRGQRNLRDLRYPYQLHWHDGGIALYSKYPLREVNIGDHPSMPWPHYKAARVYLKDDSVTIINCHLQSIGLDHEDKNVYHEITDGDLSINRLDSAGSHIMGKLTEAFMVRAVQAEWIRSVLDSISGNVIVCGDFNDVPLSYAVRTVKGDDMKDAYERNALGPNITFHDNRFYFRIDHVLYRGNIEAYKIRRDKNHSSDHYPLLVNFMFDEKENT